MFTKLAPASLTLVATLCCCSALLGVDSPPLTEPSDLFSRLDRNHDGHVTAAEVAPEHAALFRKLLATSDADHDGTLTQAELTAALKESRPRPPLERLPDPPTPEEIARAAFRRLDADRNGRIELKELPPRRQEAMRKLLPTADKDGDGALNLAEFQTVYEALLTDRPAATADHGAQSAATLLSRLKQLDTNGDGRIDAQEARGPLKNRFEKLDTDGNGVLDEAELKQAAEKLARAAQDPERQKLNQRLKSLQEKLDKK